MIVMAIAVIVCAGIWLACVTFLATSPRPPRPDMDRYRHRQRVAYTAMPIVHAQPSPAHYATLDELTNDRQTPDYPADTSGMTP